MFGPHERLLVVCNREHMQAGPCSNQDEPMRKGGAPMILGEDPHVVCAIVQVPEGIIVADPVQRGEHCCLILVWLLACTPYPFPVLVVRNFAESCDRDF